MYGTIKPTYEPESNLDKATKSAFDFVDSIKPLNEAERRELFHRILAKFNADALAAGMNNNGNIF